MERHLHIIALDTPYPVSYGGLFDIYYKIKALSQAGIKIHLHCFEKQHSEQAELTDYCEAVYYYPRRSGLRSFSFILPFIVNSRKSGQLTNRLLEDRYPILMEGIHCTFLLTDPRFSERKIIVRLHNVEYKYYRGLYKSSRSAFKKIYYLYESGLLKKYESVIANKVSAVITMAEQDATAYRTEFNASNVFYLPVFSGFKHLQVKKGMGSYCLYHGNLSVAENEETAVWLIRKVFNDALIPFIIAGKNPSLRLMKICRKYKQVTVVANPGSDEMNTIISNAQINVLPSFNTTGIKLKLLHALFTGRHCIVNNATIYKTGLDHLCTIAERADDFKTAIEQLMDRVLTEEEVRFRKEVLNDLFDEQKNIDTLIQWIW